MSSYGQSYTARCQTQWRHQLELQVLAKATRPTAADLSTVMDLVCATFCLSFLVSEEARRDHRRATSLILLVRKQTGVSQANPSDIASCPSSKKVKDKTMVSRARSAFNLLPWLAGPTAGGLQYRKGGSNLVH